MGRVYAREWLTSMGRLQLFEEDYLRPHGLLLGRFALTLHRCLDEAPSCVAVHTLHTPVVGMSGARERFLEPLGRLAVLFAHVVIFALLDVEYNAHYEVPIDSVFP